MLKTQLAGGAHTGTIGDGAPNMGRVAALVAGDLIVLLFFAASGRSTHGETQNLGAIVLTAAPFVIGWFLAATLLRAFGDRGSAATTRPVPLLQRTAPAWLLGWGVALILRALVFRGGITPAFAIVALLVNAVLLLGWRGVASAIFWRA